MNDEKMKSMRAYADAAFGQPEAVTGIVEPGNYVRIAEDADMGDDQDLIYLQDIQAVGVMRSELKSSTNWIAIQFPRGQFTLMRSDVYLVDVDALHEEMEEMIAEEAVEQSEAAAEVNYEEDVATSLHESVVNMYEARLSDYARECEAFQARVTLLTERLTPFALAALDSDVNAAGENGWLLVENPLNLTTKLVYVNAAGAVYLEAECLSVRHLNEALEALPDVAGSANGGSESQ